MSSKKVCACGQAKRCSKLQSELEKLKYYNFVGYMKVQRKYTIADRGKVAERHKRICSHLRLASCETVQAVTPVTDSRVDVAFHHFDNKIIMDHGSVVDTISYEESRQIGYVDNADRCSGKNDRYWFCPNMSDAKINGLINTLGTNAAAKLSPVGIAYLKSVTNINDVDLTKNQRLVKERTVCLDRRQLNEAVKESQARKRKCMDVTSEVANCKIEYIRKLPNNVDALKELLYENYLEKKEKDSMFPLNKPIPTISTISPCSHLGLSGKNIVSTKWHIMNSEMAMHLFGFSSFDEYRRYVKCFWPDCNVDIIEGPQEVGMPSLSMFEKLSMAKMLLTRNFSNMILAVIFGVSKGRITQILDEYVNMWGELGLHLSILTITPEFVDKSVTLAYINSGFKDVSFGLDGKDILVGSFPRDPLVMRNLWSSKVESEAMRGIAFNLQTGLTAEHSPLCGGRPSEQNTVQFWGSCTKQVPLMSEVEPPLISGVGKFGKLKYEQNEGGEMKTRKKGKKGKKGNRSVNGYNSDDDVLAPKDIEKGLFDTFVDKILISANKNAERLTSEEVISDDEFITPQLINEDLKNHLECHGPNRNCRTVLEQIDLFIRLNEEFMNCRLKKNLISHYIYHMMPDFLEMKRVIVENDSVTAMRYLSENKYPTRLGKFPLNTRGIGDKGFCKVAQFFPNLNIMVHPHLLSKGQQFTEAQIQYDKGVKEIRWKDEGVFSRLTDEQFLASLVPSFRFKYVEAAWNWGLARNNLGQPHYEPIDWPEYIIVH